jgi:hypothetical protein
VPVPFLFEGAPGGVDGTAESPSYVNEFLATSDGVALTKASSHREREVASSDCQHCCGLRQAVAGTSWPGGKLADQVLGEGTREFINRHVADPADAAPKTPTSPNNLADELKPGFEKRPPDAIRSARPALSD